MSDLIPVLVTTTRRGVFFGFIEPDKVRVDLLRLHQAQSIVSWSDMHGFLDLAATGPNAKCYVSPPVEWMDLPGVDTKADGAVTAIIAVSPAAVDKWKAQPWGEGKA